MIPYHLGNALLTVDNVSLNYGDKQILNKVHATIEDIIVDGETKGQVVGFLGPSGCGKTTLFRVIAGLEKPTSGHVYINNCNCGRPDCTRERCEVRAGDIGVVAQSYPLFAHRTVYSNLMLAAMQKEKSRKEAELKVRGFAGEFDLADHLLNYPAELSGGQRQRVAIIQQILSSAHFILMDEPFSGLDPISLEKTIHLIQKVADMDELNTIIVVTHDVTAACAVADHIWLMGREHGVPGASIVKSYNLIDEGLAWQPGIITRPDFMAFVAKIKDQFHSL